MSDSETQHPTLGGKSLEAAMANARPPYKSWRKKFRKMKAKFDLVLEDNRKLFREEQKLESLARRLTEELDGLMEILLDLNQSPALPSHLRFDVSLPDDHRLQRQRDDASLASIPEHLEPQQADRIIEQYANRVRAGHLPAMDLQLMRENLHEKLARQDAQALPETDADTSAAEAPEGHPAFLSPEQEDLYLSRLDAAAEPLRTDVKQPSHQAELTARELDRQLELLNPQSQHNWLKTHSKTHPQLEDDEGLAEAHARSNKKRQSGKNLARQVMVDRMTREAFSPSEMSGMGDDDDDAYSRKRGGEKDSTFRLKGGSKYSGSMKSMKRKRNTDEGIGGSKRVRASDIFD